MTGASSKRIHRFDWAIVAFCASLLTGVHIQAVLIGETVAGPVLLLDHIFVVTLTVALLFICAALGHMMLRRLGVADDSAIDAVAFSVALGAGLLATAILLAVAVAGVRESVLLAVVLGACALGRREMQLLPARLQEAARELKHKAGKPALILVGIMAIGMTIQAIAPPLDYDTLMYHVRIPTQFLQRGALYVPEDNLHVAYVGLLHSLYLPLIAAKAPAGCAILNVVFALLLSATLLTSCTRFLSLITGQVAMVIFWGSSIVHLVAATARVDVTLMLYLFLGHYALLRWLLSSESQTAWTIVAATLLGFASGIKYSGFVYVLAVSPIILAAAIRSGKGARQTLRSVATFGLVAAAAGTPWLVKNILLLGAPLYPYFAERMVQPWLASLNGTVNLPPGLAAAALRPLAEVREPFNLITWFMAPERLTPEIEGTAYGANIAFVMLVFALPLLRNRTFSAFVVPGLIFVALVLLRNPYLNLRYLMPALAVLTIGSAHVIATGIREVKLFSRYSGPFVFTVAICSVLPSLLVLGNSVGQLRLVAHAIGAVSRYNSKAEFNAERYVNHDLPVDARVLLLFDARGYRYSRTVIQDNNLTNWPLLISVLGPSHCLDGSGITHVLVNTYGLRLYMNRGLNSNHILWDRFDEFADRCLEEVRREPDFTLFGVRGS
jgi:hypothetical protein